MLCEVSTLFILDECLTLVASSANLPDVYIHEAGQVKGYPQAPDIRGARAPENRLGRLASLANNNRDSKDMPILILCPFEVYSPIKQYCSIVYIPFSI